MCTVTYIPLGKSSFILTHNRDESVKRRIASPPVRSTINGKGLIFPVDPQGMGTWIGASESGRVASLINGGNKEHSHTPPYRHSRGLVIPAYFRYPSFIEFFNDFDFKGLEPFTLLVFEEGNVFETVLDENQVQFRKVNPDIPFIHSSSTLYTDASRARKSGQFLEWLVANNGEREKRILDFHKMNVFENEPDKSRVPGDHILKTVSITTITSAPDRINLDYLDVLNDIRFWHSLRLRKSLAQSA